jgi:hypothetical protein
MARKRLIFGKIVPFNYALTAWFFACFDVIYQHITRIFEAFIYIMAKNSIFAEN